MSGIPPRRRLYLRLPGYDYTQAGAYFVTLCTRYRAPLLGRIVGGEMVLSPFGQIADAAWRWLGERYPYVVIDAYVIMPNHMHGVLWIVDEPAAGRGRSRTAPTTEPPAHEGRSRTAPNTDIQPPAHPDRSRTAPTETPPPDMEPTAPAGTPDPARTALTTAPAGDAPTKRKPLGRLIGAFKTVSTKQINLLRCTPGAVVWQRNYYERIARSEQALQRIRLYIQNNPARWEHDTENPQHVRRPLG